MDNVAVSRPTGQRQRKNKRGFDWSAAVFGKYLLKIAYVGTNYLGLAWQPLDIIEKGQKNPQRTVEGVLFDALKKTCCIRDRGSSEFSRCGRTDKGVHAAGNYVCVRMRRKPILNIESANETEEYDYASILNAVLPKDIRIVDVCRVGSHFDARFQCLYRIYKYYLVSFGLNIDAMRSASQQFVGTHDFRNFCKIDAEHVRHFRRSILWVKFQPVAGSAVWEIEIAGLSFLWHQIRCMVAVLVLIGKGLESPNVIPYLLDVDRCPRKPSYELASQTSLVLYDCIFEGLYWKAASDLQMRNLKAFQEAYIQQLQTAAVFQCLSLRSETFLTSSAEGNCCFAKAGSTDAANPALKRYVSLLDRKTTSESLETKREKVRIRQTKKLKCDNCC